jgi:hypothetical protein
MTAMLDSVFDDILRNARMIEENCRAYAEHIWNGGDPTRLHDSGQSWWHNPILPYADRIVNTYRTLNGKPANPYSPSSSVAFRLFDFMADYQGQWFERSRYTHITRGQHITTFLKERKLEDHGWRFEKREGSPVAYRLTRIRGD